MDFLMKSIRFSYFATACLVLLASLVGCSKEKDNAPAAPATPEFNVTGAWSGSSTSTGGTCDSPSALTLIANFTQTGNTVNGTVNGVLGTGTISGNQISISVSYPEEDGTATENITGTVNSDNEMSGNSSGSWTDGFATCSFTTSWTLSRDVSGPPPPPPPPPPSGLVGDEPCNPINASEGPNDTNTSTMTYGGHNQDCGGDKESRDAWFTFTPSQNGVMYVDTCETNDGVQKEFDTVLAVYGGTCNSLNLIDCNDDHDDFDFCDFDYLSEVHVDVSAGTTYHIQVYGYDNNEHGPCTVWIEVD
jgi:hypothetical protein